MTSASAATASRICARVAPSERSSANSRDALRDGDRERVEDDEGAHEQRRAREREQRGREEAADRVVRGVGLLGRVGGAGLDGHRARQRGAHGGGQPRGRDAGLGGDGDAREVARALEPALDVGEPRHDERGPADRGPAAPLADAGDLDVLDARAGAQPDELADAQALVLGQLAVDDDLAGPARRTALRRSGRRRTARGSPMRRSTGAKPARDRLATDHERAGVGQLALGEPHAGHRAHAREHALVDALRRLADVARERLARGDDDVGAAV